MSGSEVQKTKEIIQEYIKTAEQMNLEFFIVEANKEQGFSFPYLLFYPKSNMQNLLVMDCLNDYEEPMKPNEIENPQALETVYKLFGNHRIVRK